MKNYLEYFQDGGGFTQVPSKYFIELKDAKGNPTGHKMLKNPVFIISEEFKDGIKSIGDKIKLYNDIKKNSPEVDQNTSDTSNPSIGTIISLADYWSKNHTNPFGYSISSTSATGL